MLQISRYNARQELMDQRRGYREKGTVLFVLQVPVMSYKFTYVLILHVRLFANGTIKQYNKSKSVVCLTAAQAVNIRNKSAHLKWLLYNSSVNKMLILGNFFNTVLVVKMYSHSPMVSEILRVKSSHCNRNPCNWKFDTKGEHFQQKADWFV